MSLKSAEEWLNPSNELLMEVLGPAPVGPVETKRRIIVAIQADTYRHAAELCEKGKWTNPAIRSDIAANLALDGAIATIEQRIKELEGR